MRTRWLVVGSLIAALFAAALLQPGPVQAQPLPRSATLATIPPGTVFYALASGIAKVASGAVPFQLVVQPYTGTSTFLPMLNGGELEFGIVNGVDMGFAYQGPGRLKVGGRNPFPHTPNARLVMRGAPLLTGLLVRKDSPIKSVHQLKGKRVTGEYPAHLAVWINIFAALASAGLTWDDVKVVPVPAVNEGVDALVQGRADAALHALNSAKIREADATVGVRHISIDCSPEGEQRLRKAVPGYGPRWIKAGGAAAVLEDTCVNAYDIYLLSHKAASEQVVAALLKAVWDNVDKLPPLHPVFKEWTRERAVHPDVTIPYHPAAIAFYKERGLWSARMDDAQRKLLALNP
ncbi:MAG: TAXI family TRAP transporter solute-binding subunit [Deltaproteobacteria bacterium]|nr:TAXI family TRAP transporter solute-binding subunit [Deltaproteobacteria bacterium]MBI3077617.1 TAXI family TRAP transporter solute-binding subunit [Deltaproteobacteria bacterium]